jgi:hypothetical protein
MSMRIAAPNRVKIVPAFTVEKLEGERERTMIVFDKEGKRQEKLVKEPAGYLVKFPTKGHSIRVRNMEELKRLGFDRTIPLVDANSDDDDVLGDMPNTVAA